MKASAAGVRASRGTSGHHERTGAVARVTPTLEAVRTVVVVDQATLQVTITALHRAGWTPQQIVTEAGASPAAVARAFGAHGPAPERWTLPTLVRAVTWAEWRHGGQSVTRIATCAGVSHQRVSALTLPFGPFLAPEDDHAADWVQLRRDGITVGAIARTYGVSPYRVTTVTKPHGPYPYPRREPLDHVSVNEIARWMRVATPTVEKWQARPDFPTPLGPHRSSSRVWDRSSVQTWADRHLEPCPICAARVLDIARHRGARRH
jgi:hypothetical protein